MKKGNAVRSCISAYGVGFVFFSMLLSGCTEENRSGSDYDSQVFAAGGSERNNLFTEGWSFQGGDAEGAPQSTYDDSGWRELDLPHDWSVEGSFSQQWASCTGYLPGGVGWYRKTFRLAEETKGKKVYILFNGVYKNSEVWCNDKYIGKRPYGYISFYYDITDCLRFGRKENVIAVRVDHSDFADSRWYTGSGIYRDVFLVVTNKIHIRQYGTFVTTPVITKNSAKVDIETVVENDTGRAEPVLLESVIKDADGKIVATSEKALTIPAGGAVEIAQTVYVNRPQLWSVDNPNMYQVVSRVKKKGEVIDEYVTPVGLRQIRFDANKGFFLNGENMKIKGVCLHHDAGVLGAAVPARVWHRRLETLKRMGCNAIRTSHNPPAPEFLDLCDTMGFLVMDEAFDEWTGGKKKWVNGWNQGDYETFGYSEDFEQWAEIDLRDMLLRDRNHPSIILWSIGNEIDYPEDPFPPKSPELAEIAGRLVAVVKEYDKTRPVTAAMAAVPDNLFADMPDIAGYNYQENLYAEDHRNYPQRIIYGSENKHGAKEWFAVRDNDYISGQFLWTGIDYLGEAGRWPSRGSRAGCLDLAGFEKERFFHRKSLWTEEPMVYIARGRRGSLVCYTNCQSVEIYEDGVLVEQADNAGSNRIELGTDFTGSALKAVGRLAGVEVCSYEIKRPGPASKIVLKSDDDVLSGDGRDAALVEVNIVDENGVVAGNARNGVGFSIAGPGRIIGIENGNQNDVSEYKSTTKRAFNGRMVVYVRLSRPSCGLESAGQIKLTASAEGLEGDDFIIETE